MANNTPTTQTTSRLMSLDALRGFDMFWIVGADALVGGLARLNKSGESKNSVLAFIQNQLQHVKWDGFHFEDLIFPMFVFMVGASLVFSLTRIVEQQGDRRNQVLRLVAGLALSIFGLFLIFGLGAVVVGIVGQGAVVVGIVLCLLGLFLIFIVEQGGKTGASARVLRRAILLYALGIFFYGGFSGTFEHIRLLGVLQRIALAYLFAGLIFIFFGLRGRIAWCVGLLVGYWALMTFVPVPDGKARDFAEGHNLANWVDAKVLPLRKWDGDHDPEGLLSTLPAIANCLLGVFAGMLLRNGKQRPWHKAALLAVAGGVLLGLGWAWGTQFTRPPIIKGISDVVYFPVIKKIWTSSFVLVACGYSSLLLATFYLVIDVAGWRRWAAPFVWIGMNPITIYVLAELGFFNEISRRLVGGQLNHEYFRNYGALVSAVVSLFLLFAFAWSLYKRKVFVRL